MIIRRNNAIMELYQKLPDLYLSIAVKLSSLLFILSTIILYLITFLFPWMHKNKNLFTSIIYLVNGNF